MRFLKLSHKNNNVKSFVSNNIFRISFVLVILVELLSLFSFYFSGLGNAIFIAVSLVALMATIYKLEYGVWIVFTELFIGSMGRLLVFEVGAHVVPLRIAFWIIVMSVWASKIIINWIKEKELKIAFLKSSYFSYFFALFFFIVWGTLNGYIENDVNNLYFDLNGWVYFAFIFPVFEVVRNKKDVEALLQIFAASVLWIFIKTLFFLFFFSHSSPFLMREIYVWIRDTRIGEITQIQGGFYRIFLQSQIYSLIGFFVLTSFLASRIYELKKLNKAYVKYLFGVAATSSVVVVSLSRSFWVGLIFGMIMFTIYLFWKKYKIVDLLKMYSFIFFGIIFGLLIIVVATKFPYPSPMGGFSASSLLSDRVSDISDGAAVSSRWALLPEALQEIKRDPVLGRGFGATVTYVSSDPRVLEHSATGEFTTYAFEWGWLDIWLKLGLFGLVAYLVLIFKIIISGLRKENNVLSIGLIIGLAVISVVSIFSPYMNHPLGIGYLILVSAIIQIDKQKQVT